MAEDLEDVVTGPRLREWRTRRGWAQERLARELGVTRITVWRWEAGVVAIRPAMAKLLRRVFA